MALVYRGPAALDWSKARHRAHSLLLFQGAVYVHVCVCESVWEDWESVTVSGEGGGLAKDITSRLFRGPVWTSQGIET